MIEKIITALLASFAVAKLSSSQIDIVNSHVNSVIGTLWQPPARANKYLSALYKAEVKHGLPKGLLVRQAYQESRFREDIIRGKTISSANAQGLMQIVPRWHPDVDPLNVNDSIDYAAKYMKELHNQTGSWFAALASYNWGIGNYRKKGMENAPKETRDYVAEISADVPSLHYV